MEELRDSPGDAHSLFVFTEGRFVDWGWCVLVPEGNLPLLSHANDLCLIPGQSDGVYPSHSLGVAI